MSSLVTDEPLAPRSTPAVTTLIATCIAVLVLRYGLVKEEPLQQWFSFSADGFPSAWWTALTYPLAGTHPLPVAIDVVALWLFGPRVEESWGTRRFLLFTLACVLGAPLALVVAGSTAPLIGVSAIAFGVMLAHLWLWRHDEVWLFGVTPVQSRMVVGALVGASLLASLDASGASSGSGDFSPFAHLGGLVTAFLYLRVPQRERIEQLRQRISPVPDEPDDIARPIPRTPPRPRERPEEVDEIVARSKAAVAKRRDPSPRIRRSLPATQPPSPEELDRVLDKISAHGMSSLTPEERSVLERNARRLKDGE